MEETADADQEMPPFWLQSTDLRHRRSSSLFLSSGVLIVVLPITALILIFLVIPSILSFTSQIVRPNLVKKSWDSLNLVLVLFAILCGVLGRRNDDDGDQDRSNNKSNTSSTHYNYNASSSSSTQVVEYHHHENHRSSSDQWFGYSDHHRRIYDSGNVSADLNSVVLGRLKRSSSSYPDLRQESLWESDGHHNWRFFDDHGVYVSNRPGSSYVRRRHQPEYDTEDPDVKTIPVDTYVVHQQQYQESKSSDHQQPPPPSSAPPPPPPLPPPPPVTEHKVKRTFQAVAKKEKTEDIDQNLEYYKKVESQPPPPPPPPAAPPPPPPLLSQPQSGRSDRKRGGAAKDIASTLASFYNKRKKKNRQKSKENFDDLLLQYSPPPPPPSLSSHSTQLPPPPPPPPPPPASVFHQFFKKGSKINRRIHSVSSAASTPTPPPPPPQHLLAPPSRSSKRKTHIREPPPAPPPPPTPPANYSPRRKPGNQRGRPPLPMKINIIDENLISSSGNQSPLIPMPPPPPPPPFQIPAIRFVVRGDYVRITSNIRSRSGSPGLEDHGDLPSSTQEESTTTTTTATKTTTIETNTVEGGDAGAPALFCPSPDVNSKADNFIARFRAGLRLEKVNSMKEKQQMGNSKPGP